MRNSTIGFAAGLLFGVGLTISRMIDPAKVLGFLDVFGELDASLAFVMAGALAIMAIAWRVVGRRDTPFFADSLPAPARRDIDPQLIGGAILFGVGWGLVGLCPGPAISGIALGRWEVYLFVVALLAGGMIHRYGPLNRKPS